jgi:hypothetical protein
LPVPPEFDLPATVERERGRLPQDACEVPSMLSYDERALLHWAAREGFGAKGEIIDAGCYLGGSTLPLAYGAMRSPRPSRVHSFDLFRIAGEWERTYFKSDFPFAVGARTIGLFEQNIRPVRARVDVHDGDLLAFQWPGEAISTLFVDIAKSWATKDHVVEQFFPHLQADSVVIQQDLVHFGHPWCAMVMELLQEHFEYLGYVYYSSAVYRVRTPVPVDRLPTGLLDCCTADEALALIDRCADRIGEPAAGQIRLAGAVALASYGDAQRARERLATVEAEYNDERVPYISQGLEATRTYIDDLESGAATVG